MKRVHSEPYLEFLRTAWPEWKALVGDVDALPMTSPVRRFSDRVPISIFGRLGYYSFDVAAPIMEGTWEAAVAMDEAVAKFMAEMVVPEMAKSIGVDPESGEINCFSCHLAE